MHSQLAVAGVIVCIVFPFLASLILFLRLYTQNVKAKGLRADDYFITAGLVRRSTQCCHNDI